MVITDWAPEDRPREKMMANGEASLENAELLAILIRTGIQGKTALELGRIILENCDNSLSQLGHTLLRGNPEDSEKLKGLGDAKICTIRAALELGRRRVTEEGYRTSVVVKSSAEIFAQFNHQLSDLDHEELWAIYMSKNGKILARRRISEGGVDFSGFDIRKIVRPAIEFAASNVALCHNHPHSNIRPSRPDREATQKVKQALGLFDVCLLDHVIIADGQYYSFADNGEL